MTTSKTRTLPSGGLTGNEFLDTNLLGQTSEIVLMRPPTSHQNYLAGYNTDISYQNQEYVPVTTLQNHQIISNELTHKNIVNMSSSSPEIMKDRQYFIDEYLPQSNTQDRLDHNHSLLRDILNRNPIASCLHQGTFNSRKETESAHIELQQSEQAIASDKSYNQQFEEQGPQNIATTEQYTDKMEVRTYNLSVQKKHDEVYDINHNSLLTNMNHIDNNGLCFSAGYTINESSSNVVKLCESRVNTSDSLENLGHMFSENPLTTSSDHNYRFSDETQENIKAMPIRQINNFETNTANLSLPPQNAIINTKNRLMSLYSHERMQQKLRIAETDAKLSDASRRVQHCGVQDADRNEFVHRSQPDEISMKKKCIKTMDSQNTTQNKKPDSSTYMHLRKELNSLAVRTFVKTTIRRFKAFQDLPFDIDSADESELSAKGYSNDLSFEVLANEAISLNRLNQN